VFPLPRSAKGPLHGDHSNYEGCLSFSDEELKESWIFSGEAADCSYVHHIDSDGSGNDDNGGGDDGGDGG
jgi:hypothetical protein